MARSTTGLRKVTIAALVACAMNAVAGGFWLIVNLHDNILSPPGQGWLSLMDEKTRGWIYFYTSLSQVVFGVCLMLFFFVLWRKQRA